VSTSPIPFRADPALGGGEILWVMLATMGLLVLAFLVLAHMRRKGWLDRWLAARAGAASSAQVKWEVETQRISRQTIVHTLKRPGHSLVVVESAAGVSVTVLPAGGEAKNGDE